MIPEPTHRKPMGILLILLIIAIWAIVIASVYEQVGQWPILLQAVFYLVAGVVWIAPMGPILKWMETGKFR